MHLAAGDKIAGSVQLRVRWVHSLRAFLNARVHGLEVSRWTRVRVAREVIVGETLFSPYAIFAPTALTQLLNLVLKERPASLLLPVIR